MRITPGQANSNRRSAQPPFSHRPELDGWHVVASYTWTTAYTRSGQFRCRARAYESRFVGVHDRLHAVAEVELREDGGDVRLHRRRLDDELGGDLGVGEAAREQREDASTER